jgi:hypothetical protein
MHHAAGRCRRANRAAPAPRAAPQEDGKLLVASAAKFKSWFNVEVHESTEVVSIDRKVTPAHGAGARRAARRRPAQRRARGGRTAVSLGGNRRARCPPPAARRPPPQGRTVTARDLKTGREFQAPYDALVLSPGAQAIRPPLPGLDLPGIFQMWVAWACVLAYALTSHAPCLQGRFDATSV